MIEHDFKLDDGIHYLNHAAVSPWPERTAIAVQQFAGKAAAKGAAIDVQSSVETSAKASPEWKRLISRHESKYGQIFGEQIARIREMLNV